MELFVIIVNSFQPFTVITKWSILDVAVVLDPTLVSAACCSAIFPFASLNTICYLPVVSSDTFNTNNEKRTKNKRHLVRSRHFNVASTLFLG